MEEEKMTKEYPKGHEKALSEKIIGRDREEVIWEMNHAIKRLKKMDIRYLSQGAFIGNINEIFGDLK